MMRIFISGLLFLICAGASAQQDSLFSNLMLSPGTNVSRLSGDTLTFSSTVMPQFGIGTHGLIAPKIDLLLAAQISTRGGVSVSPYQRFRGIYADFLAMPRFRPANRIYIGAGVQYAQHISTYRILLDGSTDGTVREKVSGFKSSAEIIAAVQVNPWNRLGLEFRYSLPLRFTPYSNMQLTAHIMLGTKHDKDEKESSKRNENYAHAYDQIRDMKSGVVLVRLQSGKMAIDAIRKAGNEEGAKRREEAQQRNNKIVMRAFQEEFKFCPVYFFYADQSKLISDGQLDSLQLLDNDLKADASKSVVGKSVYIIEFADTGDDNSGTGRESVVVLDSFFVKLAKPFPGVVRASYTGYNPDQIKAAAKRMNDALFNFYRGAR